MKQEEYINILNSLDRIKRNYAKNIVKAVTKKWKGINLNNPLHKSMLRELAKVDYELSMIFLGNRKDSK